MRYDLVADDLATPLGLTLEGVGSLAGATSITFTMAQVNGSKRATGPMVVDDAVKRKVHYQWQAGDTNVPGVYRAQVSVVYPGSKPDTFPSDEPLYIVIHPKV